MPVRPLAAQGGVHPVHALLLGFPVSLFTAGLIADIAYLNTAEMQWSNFAAWAIAGALVVGGVVLAWAAIAALRGRNGWLYPLLLAVMWVLGLVNAFQHSRDAWSSVGAPGLILSILSTLAALTAGWLAFAPRTTGRIIR
ncbi:hypothetical protein M9979_00835 [Sphingomonas sp. RP10(2022)]|uniref:DUF2231 domain-containing protein n=1 Tax=Sphingomonas liriopis TaxID=2949094 RepID=A0A9X2HVF5_9SPHN|nr:DUF2231 domain-containing protein [Sphingomonas liriopis]MCP3733430.1 hypothetical protein [Sphingomonas liriopis]